MSRYLLAAAALGLSALPAAAGGYGCTGDCYRQTYVPPSYGTVAEKVMVRAPRTYAVTTPARYKHVQETVMVSPGSRHWSVTRDHYGNKVGCWVTTPARYGTVTRTVMVEAPQVVPYAEPAQYGYRTQTVMTSPGYKTWTPVGAGYGHQGGGYGASYGASYGGGYGSAGYAPRRGHHDGYGHGRRAAYKSGPSYGGSATLGDEGF
ncbi:hypothetical protein [uncultured Enterovirga sp.]|uniref:hypothetical protein n=1 Tax=uncultured Enterovirga sp. TaxID=2026352 RepID=UPI0035CB62A8